MSSKVLCVDVGDTYTRAGIWDGATLTGYRRILTHSGNLKAQSLWPDERQELWRNQLVHLTLEMRNLEPRVGRVAVCMPAIVTAEGEVSSRCGLWGAAKSGISASALSHDIGLPVTVVNDMVASATRYGRDPAFCGKSFLLMITISSGIGTKLYDMRANRVVLEPGGRNGEIALAVVDTSRKALTKSGDSTLRGILGNYSSGNGVVRLCRARATGRWERLYRSSLFRKMLSFRNLDLATSPTYEVSVELAASFRAGDRFPRRVVGESIRYLAPVLHTILLFSAPDVVVISGGFVHALGSDYRNMLVEAVASRSRFLYDREHLNEMFRTGHADDLDCLIGAGTIATQS